MALKTNIMENLDLREILKDVPRGTKLYSPLFGEIYFDSVIINNTDFPIKCYYDNTLVINFTKDGRYYNKYNSECLLFPSKEQRDWSKFELPCQFKIGDVIYNKEAKFISIYEKDNHRFMINYCPIAKFFPIIETLKISMKIDSSNYRLATHEERKLFYDELQRLGYFWNDEINSLEKYKFKIGDEIQNINTKNRYKVIGINYDQYTLENKCVLDCRDQNKFENVKFDLATLKPYDKVLVRRQDSDQWEPQLFSCLNNDKSGYCYKTILVGSFSIKQCIPYEGNEHLAGTTNNCDEYYKTW